MLINPFRFSTGITARHWRVRITANNGSSYAGLSEMFLVAPGGADISTSGKTYARSSALNATYEVTYLFDGAINGVNYWAFNASAMPATAQVDMGAPVLVSRIDLSLSTSAGINESPSAFTIDYSNDGTNWTTAISQSGQGTGTWALGSRRQFPLG